MPNRSGMIATAVATRIERQAGYELIVRDADGEVEQRFADERGAVPAGAGSAFARAGVVITMLPDGRAGRTRC